MSLLCCHLSPGDLLCIVYTHHTHGLIKLQFLNFLRLFEEKRTEKMEGYIN